MLTNEQKKLLIMKALESEEGRDVLRATMHKCQVGSIVIDGEEIISASFLVRGDKEDDK